MAGTENVTLVCGMCGRTTGLFADEWERWKKRRAEDVGIVMLCDHLVPGTKRKCLGVLHEKSETFWLKEDRK